MAVEFIKNVLPTHVIKPVKGDGFCMLHAFHESMASSLGRQSFETLIEALREELKKPAYQQYSDSAVDLKDEFEQYLTDPLFQIYQRHCRSFSRCPRYGFYGEYCHL